MKSSLSKRVLFLESLSTLSRAVETIFPPLRRVFLPISFAGLLTLLWQAEATLGSAWVHILQGPKALVL